MEDNVDTKSEDYWRPPGPVELQHYAESHYCKVNAPSYCLGCAKCTNGYIANPHCACGELAVWKYDPLDSEYRWPWYCHRCVSRGCSCNYSLAEFGYNMAYVLNMPCVEYVRFKPPIRLRGKRKKYRNKKVAY